jgi:hypothetical protein
MMLKTLLRRWTLQALLPPDGRFRKDKDALWRQALWIQIPGHCVNFLSLWKNKQHKEEMFILVHSFRGLGLVGWPIAFGWVAKQNIMVGAICRIKTSPLGSQEQREKEGPGSNTLQEHVLSDVTSSHWAPLPKASSTTQYHHSLATKPFTYGPFKSQTITASY